MYAILTLLLLALSASPVSAQQTRDKLDGVAGLSFGSSLEDAEKRPGMKRERGQLTDGRDVNVLTSLVPLFGIQFSAAFVFGDADRLSRVNFNTFYYVGFQCVQFGKPVFAQLVAAHGQPDRDVIDKRLVRQLVMTFKDGGEIRASYHSHPTANCKLGISYASAQGRKSNVTNPVWLPTFRGEVFSDPLAGP